MPSLRRPLLTNLACLALLLWVSGKHLFLGVVAYGKPAVALLAVPPLPVYALMLVATLVCGALALRAFRAKRPADDRQYRLLPVAAVVLLAIHIFVMPAYEPLRPSDELASAMLASWGDKPLRDEKGYFESDTAVLEQALSIYYAPYVRNGVTSPEWKVIVQKDCKGPVLAVPAGVAAGTLLHCIAPSKLESWTTVVGTGGKIAGEPSLVQTPEGNVLVLHAESDVPMPPSAQQLDLDPDQVQDDPDLQQIPEGTIPTGLLPQVPQLGPSQAPEQK